MLLDHNIILWPGSQKRLLRRTQKVYSSGLGLMRCSLPIGLASCRITPSTRTSMFFRGTFARCTRYFSSFRIFSRTSASWFSTSAFTSLASCRRPLGLSGCRWSKEAARVTAWLRFWWQRKGSLLLMGRRQVDWVLDQNLMWLKFSSEAWMMMGCSLALGFDLGDCILYLFEPDFLLEGGCSSFFSSSLRSTSIREKLRSSIFLFSRLTEGFLMASASRLLSSSICSLKSLTFSWNASFLAQKAEIWSQLNLFLLNISLQSRFDFSRSLLQMSQMICWRARSIVLQRPWTSRMAAFCFCFFSRSCAFSSSHTGDTLQSRPTEETLLFSTDRFFFSRLSAATAGLRSRASTGFCLNWQLSCPLPYSPLSRASTIFLSVSTSSSNLLVEQAKTWAMMSCRLILSFWLSILTSAAFILRWRSSSSSPKDLLLSMEYWQVSRMRAPTRPISLAISSKATGEQPYFCSISACQSWMAASCWAILLMRWWCCRIWSLMKGSSSCEGCLSSRRLLYCRRSKWASSMSLMFLSRIVQSLLRCDYSSQTSAKYMPNNYIIAASFNHHPHNAAKLHTPTIYSLSLCCQTRDDDGRKSLYCVLLCLLA